jgi:hypothetical protein
VPADPLGFQAPVPPVQPILHTLADLQDNVQQLQQMQQQTADFQQQTAASLELIPQQIAISSHNAHARIMNSRIVGSETRLWPLRNEVPGTVVSLLSCRPAGGAL